jgi:hypothetical protein
MTLQSQLDHSCEKSAVDWMRYLAPDWWQREKIDSIDRQLRAMRRSAPSANRVDAELDNLASDLGKAMLLVHALIETCVRKGVLTREEIAEIIRELDLRDGAADGQLRTRAKSSRPTSVHEFLGQLAEDE